MWMDESLLSKKGGGGGCRNKFLPSASFYNPRHEGSTAYVGLHCELYNIITRLDYVSVYSLEEHLM